LIIESAVVSAYTSSKKSKFKKEYNTLIKEVKEETTPI